MLGEALLLERDPEGALAEFEAALRVRSASEIAPLDLGEAEFAVARALRLLARDPARVERLAAQARARFEGAGDVAAAHRRDMADWEKGLLDRPRPAAPRR